MIPLVCAFLFLALVPFPMFGRNLWSDEAFTASYMAHPHPAMVLDDVRKNEETPPLYFLVLWGWSRLAGQSEVALRMPSLIAALLAVALLTFVVQRWLTSHEALLAGATVALSLFVAKYTVEARAYMLLLLLTVVCLALFERIYHYPTDRLALAGYTIAVGALFLTFYLGIVMLLSHTLIWATRSIRDRVYWKRDLVTWVVVVLGAGLMVSFWLPSLLYQVSVTPDVAPMAQVSPGVHLVVLFSLLLYYPGLYAPSWQWAFWAFLAGFSWLLIANGLLRSRQHDYGLTWRVFGVPAIITLLFNISMHLSAARYMTILVPGMALALASGWGALYQRFRQVGVVAAVLLLVGMLVYRLPDLLSEPSMQRAWPAFAARVAQQVDPNQDTVMFQPPWEQRTFEYYYQGPDVPLLGAHHYDEFYAVEGYDFRTSWTVDEALPLTRDSRYIWLFDTSSAYSLTALDLPYPLVDEWQSGPLKLSLYEVVNLDE
jgi:4-amino-4-deoxy-L-arabinose transferase-like glycosyltransferase